MTVSLVIREEELVLVVESERLDSVGIKLDMPIDPSADVPLVFGNEVILILLKDGVEMLALVFKEVGSDKDVLSDGNDVTRIELEAEDSVRLFEAEGEVDDRTLLALEPVDIDGMPDISDLVLIPVETDNEV